MSGIHRGCQEFFCLHKNVLYRQSTTTASYRQISYSAPDIATGDVIDDVRNSFSYTKNAIYGLTTTKMTSDPIPEVCTGVVPPDQKANTDDYVLMQAAAFSEKAHDPDQELSKATVKSCNPNNPGREETEAATLSVKSCDSKFPDQTHFSGLAKLSETSCDPNDPN